MDSIRSSSRADACIPDTASSVGSPTPTAAGPSSNTATSRETGSGSNQVEAYVCRYPATSASLAHGGAAAYCGPSFSAATLALLGGAPPAPSPAASFSRADGTSFPTSTDGTPMYRQSDAEWGEARLGVSTTAPTLASRGCAVTSMAMALSKLSGETLTPGALDAHLDAHAGYSGNALVWGAAGSATEKSFAVEKTTAWSASKVDAELAAGRPVVLGVDYKEGGSGGTLGTDHWVCLTRKEGDTYYANDPATGNETSFTKQADGTLLEVEPKAGQAQPYRSSGEFTTFKPAVSA